MTTITITGKKPGKTDVTISSTVNPAVKTDVPVTVLSRNLLSYGPAEGNGLTATVNTDGSLHVTGAAPGITVTAPTPGTYRFKGSTTTGAGSWNNLTSVVHVDAGTYTMDATDWPLGNDSWLMGIQAHISPDDGSEGANVFGPRNYGQKTLKAGTLQCNIFVNTTGEVDKTFTPRLYKID